MDLIERYYDAWTRRDEQAYRRLWADDSTFADPPEDGVTPPTGPDEIVAGLRSVWDRAEAITYERVQTWRCGSAIAVHVLVTMTTSDGVMRVPVCHVFRLGRDHIRHLEAFLDLTLVELVSGRLPDWVPAA